MSPVIQTYYLARRLQDLLLSLKRWDQLFILEAMYTVFHRKLNGRSFCLLFISTMLLTRNDSNISMGQSTFVISTNDLGATSRGNGSLPLFILDEQVP
jgi:hypothetical protein